MTAVVSERAAVGLPQRTGVRVSPRRRRRGSLKHYLLVAPAVLLSATVVLVPAVLTAVTAFTDWDGVATSAHWVGLGNFRHILADDVFWTALGNNLKWTVVFLTVPVAIGLATAMLLLRRPRSRTLYQVIFLVPYVLAAITNAMLWLNIIYNPISGVFGYLRDHGLDIKPPLANLDTALYAVALVDVWHFWGFLTVVYLAALRQTPTDQVEAAIVAGANGVQLFRYVYFPNIKATFQLLFVMTVIFSFLAFDYVFLLTGGGPAHATEMLSTYAYTFAFATFQFGKAAAVGLTMSLFGLVCSFAYTWLSRKDLNA
jgi:raffinose/stachyose/melibiose transport system permease protein